MIALYCPTDFISTSAQFSVLGLESWVQEAGEADSPEGVLLGGKRPQDVPELARMANPGTYVTDNAPAFQFFHGDDDRVVPYLQSMNLAVKLAEAVGYKKIEYYLIHGAGHNQKHFMNEENYDLMVAFLKKHFN